MGENKQVHNNGIMTKKGKPGVVRGVVSPLIAKNDTDGGSSINSNMLSNNKQKNYSNKAIFNSRNEGLLGGFSDGNSFNEQDVYDELYDDTASDNINGKGTISFALKKLPLTAKLSLIGLFGGIILLVVFLVVFITPLIELNIIDITGTGGPTDSNRPAVNLGSGYSSITGSADFWWPIGSSNITSSGGADFASGNPSWTTITSNYGPRVHPITGEVNSFHTGVDIADGKSAGTTSVIASRGGKVVYPSSSDRVDCPTSSALDNCGGGYGNYVLIDHGDGSSTLYAHLHYMSITVYSGESVSQGQIIGKIGSSGNSTGPHLHFEVRYNGSTVEPLNYVSMSNPRP